MPDLSPGYVIQPGACCARSNVARNRAALASVPALLNQAGVEAR